MPRSPGSSRKRSPSRPTPPPSTHRIALALVIVIAGIVTYWNGLSSPFIWDDDTAVVSNPTIHHLWPLTGPFRPPRETPVAGRPLVNLSLAVNYALGGLDETGYRATNLALHLACALLLFAIVRRTLTLHGGARLSDRAGVLHSPDSAALLVTLVWMLHPLQSEVVDYVTQRSESIMALCLLATLYAAIRGQAAGRRAADRRWAAVVVLACASGMLAKESMIVAPLVVVLYDWAFLFDSFGAAFRARGSLYAGLAATWLVAAATLWTLPRSTVGASATVGPFLYLLNQAQMIGRYLRLSVWPGPLVLDYGLPRSLTIVDVLPAAILIAALIAGTVVALVRARAIGFLAAAFFLTLAPTSSVIPIRSEVGAERRMYVPFMALAALVVVGARALLDRAVPAAPPAAGVRGATRGQPILPAPAPGIRVAVWAAAGVVLVALSARTIARNGEYRSPLAIWRTVVDRRPHGRARMALATELATAGRHDEAVAQLRVAVADFPDARAALGTELLLQKNTAEGVAWLRQFIADGPSLPNRLPAHILLAQAFAADGRLDQSAAEWRIVVAAAPGDAVARRSLGQVLAAEAEAALQDHDQVRGETYARDAVRFAPDDARAHNLLGVALASRGDLRPAESHFREALQLAPGDPEVRANLDRVTRALGAARSGPQ